MHRFRFIPFLLLMVYGWISLNQPFFLPPPYLGNEELGRNLSLSHEENATTGAGTHVAVMDIFPSHVLSPLQKKSVRDLDKFRSLPDFLLPDDPVEHGQHVADIITQLAPEANVLRLSVSLDPQDFKLMVEHQEIDVINASAFMGGDWIVRDLGQALKSGKILVLAAGNNGMNLTHGFHPFRHILTRLEGIDPALMGQVVLALNLARPSLTMTELITLWMGFPKEESFALHPSSNFPGPIYAGISIAAPGESIANSSFSPSRRMTGTSASAPVVTASLAHFLEYAQRLSPLPRDASPEEKVQRARTVVKCLFQGAKKITAKGRLSHHYFGQGILHWEGSYSCLKTTLKDTKPLESSS